MELCKTGGFGQDWVEIYYSSTKLNWHIPYIWNVPCRETVLISS